MVLHLSARLALRLALAGSLMGGAWAGQTETRMALLNLGLPIMPKGGGTMGKTIRSGDLVRLHSEVHTALRRETGGKQGCGTAPAAPPRPALRTSATAVHLPSLPCLFCGVASRACVRVRVHAMPRTPCASAMDPCRMSRCACVQIYLSGHVPYYKDMERLVQGKVGDLEPITRGRATSIAEWTALMLVSSLKNEVGDLDQVSVLLSSVSSPHLSHHTWQPHSSLPIFSPFSLHFLSCLTRFTSHTLMSHTPCLTPRFFCSRRDFSPRLVPHVPGGQDHQDDVLH